MFNCRKLFLWAQLSEALECIKSQDLALSQKTQEIKQMQQNLKRTRDGSLLHFTLNHHKDQASEEMAAGLSEPTDPSGSAQ